MSEQPQQPTNDDRKPDDEEAATAGSTSQEYGNLSVEDDAEGTVDPADLAGTGSPEDDAVPD